MHSEWRSQGADYLLGTQMKDGSWSVRPDANAMIEPTCYAAMALLSQSESDSQHEVFQRAAFKAAEFLAARQTNGYVTTVPVAAQTGWITTLCLLIWSEFEDRFKDPIDQACHWLLGTHSATFPIPESKEDRILGHDSTLDGWPWVNGTCPWTEPTVYAVLALRKCGFSGHKRVNEGLRVIRDRQMEDGTWNFGNTTVFGHLYPSQPTATGLGLLALWSDTANELHQRGCEYLQTILPTTRSAASLCWGLLGLDIGNRRPESAEIWLSESFAKSRKRSNPILQIAYLLLASGKRALPLLGFQQVPPKNLSPTNEEHDD
jgi:hypothetical protein